MYKNHFPLTQILKMLDLEKLLEIEIHYQESVNMEINVWISMKEMKNLEKLKIENLLP
jgi:hypothetical protein